MERCEHEGMQGTDGGQQQGSGQAGFSKPHDVAGQDAGGNEDIVTGRVSMDVLYQTL